MSPRLPRAPRLAAVLAALLVGTALGVPPAAAGHPDRLAPTRATEPGLYLVTLVGHGTASHPLTRPAPGQRLDVTSAGTRALAQRLRDRQDRVLASVGNPAVVSSWTTALNGFAARLDTVQVKSLRSDPRVALVERNSLQHPAGHTAAPLGLDRPRARLDGADEAGDGVVVGLVDSGIWPENPAFAGLPAAPSGRSEALPGFHGSCGSGERWSAGDCNDKIVSARWFVDGFGAGRTASHELLSPRDVTGHGSHTASTVAGAADVVVRIAGQRFGRSAGVAPGARLAVYKACWTAPDPADDGCATADTVAAVDQAVADGVDVLAYAVTGSADPRDTVSRAFLGATLAGVFVAAAAGNDGPRDASVGHTAPWVTTVGAATQRRYAGSVRLDDGTVLTGAMVSDRRVPARRLVPAGDVAADGVPTPVAARCENGSLDARRAEGAVVVCERGVVPRVEKSAAVAAAGGAGMVLLNTGPGPVEADVHAVPTVHLPRAEARTLEERLRRDPDLRATLRPGPGGDTGEPRLAPESGRGPVPGVEVLKPEVVAPGSAVVGAVAPPSTGGALWDLRSGTSVSAAHVAGLAALLTARHPAWDPSRLRSALVTTADPVAGAGAALAQGAGHVDADELLRPGVVLGVRGSTYLRFLEGELDGRDLNVPWVVVEDLVGTTTVTRRVTNVGAVARTYTAQVRGLDGFEVSVRPATVRVPAGATRAVRVTVRATAQASGRRHATGVLVLAGPGREVRIPLAARAAVRAPEVVAAPLGRGEVTVRGRSGTGRPVRPEVVGLAGADPLPLSLRPVPFDGDGDTFATTVSVPVGAEAARFEVRSRHLADDLDLRVLRDGEVVEEATGPASSAVVTLLAPRPGDYRVEVVAARAGDGAVAAGELTSWVVGAGGAETLELATRGNGSGAGPEFRYAVRWPELDPSRRWLGVVRYPGSDEVTLLRIG
ncbi:MAG TPA: S8 family serine peptidase [Nocardioides sp.]|nr:S8 family serine peptidase [Nocardioides sp.]